MSEAPTSVAKSANFETQIGVDMCILVNGGTIKLDLALQKDARATQVFMDAVAVLIGLKQAA